MSFYQHNSDKTSGDGLAITEWNDLSNAIAGNSGLHLALNPADKVGIGTNSPAEKLDIYGASPKINIRNTEETDSGIVFSDDQADNQKFEIMFNSDDEALHIRSDDNNGADIMTMLHEGNVGIGTTSPSEKLEVNGTLKAGHFIGDGSQITNLSVGATGLNIATTNGSKVGIGTASPTKKLHVSGGDVQVENAGEVNIGLKNSSDNQDWLIGTNSNGFYIYNNDNSEYQMVIKGNKVGIGVTNPGIQLAIGDNDTGFQQQGDGELAIYTNGDERMRIDKSGNVGIGITDPTKAKLEISGYIDYQFDYYAYTPKDDSASNGVSSISRWLSIYAEQSIAAHYFLAKSDARIKNIQGCSNGTADLHTLKQIEISDYTHQDPAKAGFGPQKKVIGQQIAEVYPQAVSTHSEVVPDIMQKAQLQAGYMELPGIDLEEGEKLQLIFPEGENAELATVLESGEGRIKVDTDKSGDVFVYGREVDDFHVVDYDALSMLHISATQELIKNIEKQQKEQETLKAENEQIKANLVQIRKHLSLSTETVSGSW